MTEVRSIGGFRWDPTPSAEIERIESAYAGLTGAVRDLVDATIRSTVELDEVEQARLEVEAVVARLRRSQVEGPAGVYFNDEGRSWNWGNTVVGKRNAFAPPLRLEWDDDGLVHSEVTLGAAYEGPPGLVHGGVTALLLDHLMGETASDRHTRVTFTGTLTLRYVRGTPLGPLRLEGRIERTEGRKVFVVATIGDAEGPTVEAHGIFIVPSWAVAQEAATAEAGLRSP